MLDGKAVLGHPKEIQEVLNAFTAYEAMPSLDPTRLDDMLSLADHFADCSVFIEFMLNAIHVSLQQAVPQNIKEICW